MFLVISNIQENIDVFRNRCLKWSIIKAELAGFKWLVGRSVISDGGRGGNGKKLSQ